MSADKEYWHNRGEQDASKGRHSPPHQGSTFSSAWWDSDMGGRPVTDRTSGRNTMRMKRAGKTQNSREVLCAALFLRAL